MEQAGPSTSRFSVEAMLPAARTDLLAPEDGPQGYPRSELGGSSVAPETAPPLYESEVGIGERVVQPV